MRLPAPGREMLFTLVDSESRFKAKPVIDTVVYRGGDVATAWFYTTIVSVFGLGLAGVAIVGAFFRDGLGGCGYLPRRGDLSEQSTTGEQPRTHERSISSAMQ